MTRSYFLKTDRTAFSTWQDGDITLAKLLWGNADVTKYICASGKFTASEIEARLNTEIYNNKKYNFQYWPFFEQKTDELIGCCGLRPHSENRLEIGFHLRPKFWGRGYAVEAASAVIGYAFTVLDTESLFAGHNPNNTASQKVLSKLGFKYIGDEFYKPTGLYHPSYQLTASDFKKQ